MIKRGWPPSWTGWGSTVPVGDDIGAICVSRPTNPPGNVLTDDEIARLKSLAAAISRTASPETCAE